MAAAGRALLLRRSGKRKGGSAGWSSDLPGGEDDAGMAAHIQIAKEGDGVMQIIHPERKGRGSLPMAALPRVEATPLSPLLRDEAYSLSSLSYAAWSLSHNLT